MTTSNKVIINVFGEEEGQRLIEWHRYVDKEARRLMIMVAIGVPAYLIILLLLAAYLCVTPT